MRCRRVLGNRRWFPGLCQHGHKDLGQAGAQGIGLGFGNSVLDFYIQRRAELQITCLFTGIPTSYLAVLGLVLASFSLHNLAKSVCSPRRPHQKTHVLNTENIHQVVRHLHPACSHLKGV